MKKYLLVDGYNIINSWAELKNIPDGSLEESRDKLIQMLAGYRSYTDQEIWVIFDAYQQKSSRREHEKILGIYVVYTKEKQTADSFIEIKVKELSKKRTNEIRVATSDWAEQQIVMGMGAVRISARELLIEIMDVTRHINRKTENLNQEKTFLSDRINKNTAKILEKWLKDDN